MEKNWHRVHPDFRLNGIPLGFGELESTAKSLLQGKDFEHSIGEFLLSWTSDNPMVEVLTSGSTGTPKRIEIKKEHMINSAMATGDKFQLEAKQTALLCLSCTGIAGKMMLVRSLVLGLELDAVEPSSDPLPNNGKPYDFVAMVPLQLQNSLGQLDRIGTLIIGGAPLDGPLKERLKSKGGTIYETYGMTETVSHIAVKEVAPRSWDYFECLPQVEVGMDERGCLLIEAPGISDIPVITNDLVELLGKTKFKWLGRFDSIINSGGIKLLPEKIEEKLAPLMESRFFVSGIPDRRLGQRLVLIVEGRAGDGPLLIERIKELDGLSKYEIPKSVHFVETFVETDSRKVHRKKTLEKLIPLS